MTAAPKPCPFCGSDAVFTHFESVDRWSIECGGEDCPLQNAYSTEAEAVAAWNRREGGGE